MNDFKFVSEEYSIHNSKNYRLSIQLNKDGFSVLIKSDKNKILSIIHRQTGSLENTRKAFKYEEDFINLRELSFQSFTILLNTSLATVLPEEITAIHDKVDIFRMEFDVEKQSLIKSKKIDALGSTVVFNIPEDIEKFISSFYNKPVIDHISSEFLKYILKTPVESKYNFFIYTSPGILHLALLFYGELKFHNSFNCKNNDEMLYHLMNSIRQLKISSSTHFYYSGHLKDNDNSWKILLKYLPKLKQLPNEFSFELAWDVNENYFSYLLNSTGENN